MNLNRLIDQIKKHPDFHKVGMILCHGGVVRGTSRSGKKVRGLTVSVDYAKLGRVIETHKKRKGIVEILVDINSGKPLYVGDDIMMLVVAGDIRDNVIPTLNDALNAIKSTVTEKEEYLA